MKLIVVGCNPGDRSARVGHYYAGRSNAFWPLLYESGVLPEELNCKDDKRIIEFGIGLTDLVKRSTRDHGRDRARGVCRRAHRAFAEAGGVYAARDRI